VAADTICFVLMGATLSFRARSDTGGDADGGGGVGLGGGPLFSRLFRHDVIMDGRVFVDVH